MRCKTVFFACGAIEIAVAETADVFVFNVTLTEVNGDTGIAPVILGGIRIPRMDETRLQRFERAAIAAMGFGTARFPDLEMAADWTADGEYRVTSNLYTLGGTR